MVHRLKILPEYFHDVESRKKNFELRKNDRDFNVGDTVILEEWNGIYTGKGVTRKIKYILKDRKNLGLEDGYCIFGW